MTYHCATTGIGLLGALAGTMGETILDWVLRHFENTQDLLSVVGTVMPEIASEQMLKSLGHNTGHIQVCVDTIECADIIVTAQQSTTEALTHHTHTISAGGKAVTYIHTHRI